MNHTPRRSPDLTRIGVVEAFGDHHDEARAPHTDVLGIHVNDARYGDSVRWRAIVSPEEPDGPPVLLTPMNDSAAATQAQCRTATTAAISLTTSSRPSHKKLTRHGAVFVSEPHPWARTQSTPPSRMGAATGSTPIRADGAQCGC
jgi:hypothetical protein